MKNNFFLTIDVGIKNLAICICKYENNEKKSILSKINIINWEIIDVAYKPLYCKEIKNKRAICNCISKYYSLKNNKVDHSNPDNLIGYCKNHAKNIREFNKKKINKNNKINLYNINLNPIYKNNFNTQMDKLLIGLEKFFSLKILNPYDYFDNKFEFINNLEIYIENQPVFKNPIMKSISVSIYTFFCIKKMSHPKIISSINFINATVKTKKDFIIKLNNFIDIKSNIKNFKSYTNRKDFSEDIIKQIIPKLSYSREYINNIISTSNYTIIKKKDDLADTLLYQLYIIIYFYN
jgi:hypothetical protein